VPVEDVARFESEFLDHIRASESDILAGIRESKKLSEEATEKLVASIGQFKKGFAATDGSSVVPDERVEALDEDELAKEAVQVRKAPPAKKK
jgi:F-type H+-transporting ATPase subunit alpha